MLKKISVTIFCMDYDEIWKLVDNQPDIPEVLKQTEQAADVLFEYNIPAATQEDVHMFHWYIAESFKDSADFVVTRDEFYRQVSLQVRSRRIVNEVFRKNAAAAEGKIKAAFENNNREITFESETQRLQGYLDHLVREGILTVDSSQTQPLYRLTETGKNVVKRVAAIYQPVRLPEREKLYF